MSASKEKLLKMIAPEVTKIDQALAEDLEYSTLGRDPLLKEVLHYGIFNGGKRLRPLLVLLAAQLVAEGVELEEKRLLQLAIAFEYLHDATLYHDDVIDKADMRRGKASVVKQFGLNAAILGGDFLHSRSMFLVASIAGEAALEIFCRATSGMVDGEFLQLRNATNSIVGIDEYFAVVQAKTALLISAACEIGAMFGRAGSKEQKVLADYGLALGVSFQIVDDLLDYQGVSEHTGKAVGNDFYEGKLTLPVLFALENSTAKSRDRLLFLLSTEQNQNGAFEEAYSLIEQNNGFSASRTKAEQILNSALTNLEMFSGTRAIAIQHILRTLAEYVLLRKK